MLVITFELICRMGWTLGVCVKPEDRAFVTEATYPVVGGVLCVPTISFRWSS